MLNGTDPHSEKVNQITQELKVRRGRLAVGEAIKQLKVFGRTIITPEMYESGAVLRKEVKLKISKSKEL